MKDTKNAKANANTKANTKTNSKPETTEKTKTNANFRPTSTILPELEKACASYSVERLKHDSLIANGQAISAQLLKSLAKSADESEKLCKEYNDSAKAEFYSDCKKASEPIKAFFLAYVFNAKKVIDTTVSKKDSSFAKREAIDIERVGSLFDFEETIGVAAEIIDSQKNAIASCATSQTLEVAKKLGCEKSLTISGEIAKGKPLAGLQAIIDRLYFEAGADGKNLLVAEASDLAYLGYAFSRKGKGVGNVRVSNARQLVSIICDMVHLSLAGETYSISGYKSENK